MKSVELIYLSQEDVVGLKMPMGDVITIVENVLREHGLGHFENPPKPGIHPQPDAFIHGMPGYLPRQKAAGLKWVSSFSGNAGCGIPPVMGLFILNDIQTGQPLAVMDCRWITAVRTGAVSAVAARYLANKNSRTVGIIGAGIQGRYNLLALAAVMPDLERVRVFDINPRMCEGFVAALDSELQLQFEIGQSPRDVIEGADIIVTATGRLDEPIFKEKWISPGALVLPVHHRGWENQTLHRVDKFVTDDWQQLKLAHETVGGFDGPLPESYAELGKIIIGEKPGRENEAERIIDFNYGLAIEDVAMANEIYMRAKANGLGQILPLIKDDLPFA
ncbi:MAG: ornithine cyclodeaminase family protein [Deltaproteobacteria bacterium]|jgi:ornithine cyclodeaminase/alanine dehydrogenase|nr:ornithine cyclodeaminase family protein [Deltaproteobacteria bacterium]